MNYNAFSNQIKEIEITKEMIKISKNYKTKRDTEKEVLKQRGQDYDKFTTDDDAYIGKLGEIVFEIYLKQQNLKIGEDFISWSDRKKKTTKFRDEFYDKWDYKIVKNDTSVTIDVKTGQTSLVPKPQWNYGYPVVQSPEKKDYIVLVYIIYKSNSNKTPIKGKIVGWMTGKEIKNYRKTMKNGYAGFRYKTLNHDTVVKDYKNIDELLAKFNN